MNHDFCQADMFTLSSCHQIFHQWKILVQMATDAEAVFSTNCSREKKCCLKHHGNMRGNSKLALSTDTKLWSWLL